MGLRPFYFGVRRLDEMRSSAILNDAGASRMLARGPRSLLSF